VTRADLPADLTPDAVRRLDLATIRRLSRPGNGVLDATDQARFDASLREVMGDTADRLQRSLRRAGPGAGDHLDPQLRRNLARTEARLAAQARRARQALPQFTEGWDLPAATIDPPGPGPASPVEPAPTTTPEDPPAVDTADADPAVGADDEISLGQLEADIDQATDTLEILERIASLQAQQLEHQRNQVLHDVRGVFFALLVSVAVIVAGVAPLVEAEPHDRRLIVLWTVAICGTAALGYAVVRAIQARADRD
jgi:hypothetical protein